MNAGGDEDDAVLAAGRIGAAGERWGAATGVARAQGANALDFGRGLHGGSVPRPSRGSMTGAAASPELRRRGHSATIGADAHAALFVAFPGPASSLSTPPTPPDPPMQTIAITGANRGIGLATAQTLAADGHRILLLCRDERRGRRALATLPPLHGEARHHLVLCDLASLESVREAARRILDPDRPLDALVNNAAALPRQRTLSRDGFELQLAVTHLGHFLLTHILLPLLRRGAARAGKSRIVTVSSAAHAGPPFDFDDPHCERRRYRRTQVYQQSKLANVLFTAALARRVAGEGVEPVALHPGVYDTEILRDYLGRGAAGGAVRTFVGTDPDRAGPILAALAAGRRDEALAGKYLDKSVVTKPSRAARDRDAQERLWAWSLEAVGLGGRDG